MMYSRYTPNQNGGYERRRVPNRPQRPAMPPPPEPPHPPHGEQHPPHGTSYLPHEPPHLPYMPPSPPPRPPKPQPQGGLLGGLSGLLHGTLQKGDLLMLAILYLILSEDEEDSSLPIIAIALYLILK